MATSMVSEIKRRAEEIPNKPAYIFISHDWTRLVLTFQDIFDLGGKFAARLHKLGLQPGDVVCNTVANSPERLITQVGTLMAGCIDMNGQLCLADGSDFISSLNNGSAKAVIHNPNDSKGAFGILKAKLRYTGDNERTVECPEVVSLQTMIPCVLKTDKGNACDNSLLEELAGEDESVCIDRGPDSVAAYMCTSGSTGLFKLVSFSSNYISSLGEHWAYGFGITSDSVTLNDRPMGWIGGYPVVVFIKGSTTVVLDWTVPRKGEVYTRFTLDAVRQEKCTEMLAVPLQLLDLVREVKVMYPNGYGYLLKTLGVGGGPLKKNITAAIGIIAEQVSALYGSSENGLISNIFLTGENDQYEDFVCGWPAPGTQIKIVKANMEPVKCSEVGDILIKKEVPCNGYVNNEESTKEVFLPGGWVKLGDRGFIDDKGRLSVLGRSKNAIMRGAIIFYPEPAEACLQTCPGIASIAVVGVPDKDFFEEICALVVPEPSVRKEAAPVAQDDAGVVDTSKQATRNILTVEDVRKFCKENLFLKSDNNEFCPMPKYFIFVDELPKLGNGKLDRGTAKKLAADLVSAGKGM